ncbi:MAG: tautomerase family protein [Anaerolineae bacterium]
MPVIRVTWWAGRSCEQKTEVAKGITEVLHKVGIPPEATQVVFEDVPKENWCTGGVPASQRQPGA